MHDAWQRVVQCFEKCGPRPSLGGRIYTSVLYVIMGVRLSWISEHTTVRIPDLSQMTAAPNVIFEWLD